MGKHLDAAVELGKAISLPAAGTAQAMQQQCLRILRCTAHALANSPGGLKFKAGTRPWLDALSDRRGDMALAFQRGG